MLKCWDNSTTIRNYAVTYYKTLDEIPWNLGQKELQKWQKFQKAQKNCANKYKIARF